MYSIKFADGERLTGLQLNGNNFISLTPIDSGFFTEKRLANVTVKGDGITEALGEVKLIQCIPFESGSAFILEQISPEEKRQQQLRADIDYLLLMSNLT